MTAKGKVRDDSKIELDRNPMMRLFLFLLFILSLDIHARDWETEARVAYFRPRVGDLRQIYPNGWVQYQVQAATTIWGPFGLWANAGFMNTNGHSLGLHQKTRLRIYPLSFGGLYYYCFPPLCVPGYLDAYIGVGPTYSTLKIHDEGDRFIKQHVAKNVWGVTAKSALRYHFCGCGYIGAFIDYYHSRFPFKHDPHCVTRRNVDTSGFLYGGSLGFSFEL